MKLNQKGFGAVEILIVIVVIALVGFVGWRVYDASESTDEVTNTTQQANEEQEQNTNELATDETEGSNEDQESQVNAIPEGWVKYSDNELDFSFYHQEGARGPDLGIRTYDGGREIIDSWIYVETVKNAAQFSLFNLNCETDACITYYEEEEKNEREMWSTRVDEVDVAYGADRLFHLVRVEKDESGKESEYVGQLLAVANGRNYVFSAPFVTPQYDTEETVNQIISTVSFSSN